MNSSAQVIAAWCGTGKSHLVATNPRIYAELECWKYDQGDFPDNYIRAIKSQIGITKYLFISTNPVVLRRLYDQGIKTQLIYPEEELKLEYFERYKQRGSSQDFIDLLDKNWREWLTELQEQDYCEHTVLKSGQFLEDVTAKEIKGDS